jgi:hypothetical protein
LVRVVPLVQSACFQLKVSSTPCGNCPAGRGRRETAAHFSRKCDDVMSAQRANYQNGRTSMRSKLTLTRHKGMSAIAGAEFLFVALSITASLQAGAQEQKALYPAMAPFQQYLIADQQSEIALARSSAPASISGDADVMVLGQHGYSTAVKGSNGFVCIVERSWNPKLRSPNCFNAAAARTFLLIYLMKTRMVLAGKSKTEIAAAVNAALDKKELPALEAGSMCYMMSSQQYLNDQVKSWHPHLMFLAPGDAASSWGANLPESPIMAVVDAEERVTIFMVLTGNWSDGAPAPQRHAGQ